MSEATETSKIEMIRLEAEVRFPVEVRKDYFDEAFEGRPLEDVSGWELDDFVNEQDVIHDAFNTHMEDMGSVDIDAWGAEVVERTPEQPIGPTVTEGFYSEPAPDLLGRFNLNTGTRSEGSPYSVFNDDQLAGAMSVLRQVYGGRTMHKAQRDEIMRHWLEMEHIQLARPSMHAFKPLEDAEAVCKYCGNESEGHYVATEK